MAMKMQFLKKLNGLKNIVFKRIVAIVRSGSGSIILDGKK